MLQLGWVELKFTFDWLYKHKILRQIFVITKGFELEIWGFQKHIFYNDFLYSEVNQSTCACHLHQWLV